MKGKKILLFRKRGIYELTFLESKNKQGKKRKVKKYDKRRYTN